MSLSTKTRLAAFAFLAALAGPAASAPGQVDQSFGNAGQVTLDFSYSHNLEVRAAIAQGDKIVLAGTVPRLDGYGTQVVLSRIDRYGQRDTSFGQQGWARESGGYPDCKPRSMAFGPSGDIYVFCTTADVHEVLRFSSDGYGGGIVGYDSFVPFEPVFAVNPADGSYYIGGTGGGGPYLMTVRRYNPWGGWDNTYGTPGYGYAEIFFAVNEAMRARAAVLDASGALLIAATVGPPDGTPLSDMMVVRVLPSGMLDTAFGSGGRAVADFGGGDDHPYAMQIDSAGRIVVAGRAGHPTLGGVFGLWRLTPGGLDDTGFYGTGRVARAPSESVAYDSHATAFTFDAGGRITAAGPARRIADGNVEFAVMRLLDNGMPENYWGACDPQCGAVVGPSAAEADYPLAIASVAFESILVAGHRGQPATHAVGTTYQWYSGMPLSAMQAYLYAIVPYASLYHATAQADGRILAIGSTDWLTALVRFNANGSIDTTFGVDGFADIWNPVFEENPVIHAQPDGNIIIAAGGWYLPYAWRFLPNGTQDPAWIGWELVPGYSPKIDLQADGKLVAALTRSVPPPQSGPYRDQVVVTRLNANGTKDTAFGTNGEILVPFHAGAYGTRSVQVLARPEGIYVVGSTQYLPGTYPWDHRVSVWRLLPDGTLDPSFGTNGVATVPQGAMDFARGAVHLNGRILVAGVCVTPATGLWDTCIAAFDTTGALDSGFGTSGIARHALSTSDDSALSIKVDAGGKILVGGHNPNGVYVMRLHANGSRDTAYNGTGLAENVLPGGWMSAGTAQPDGGFVVGGQVNPGAWTLTRVEGGGWDTTPPETSLSLSPSASPTALTSATATFSSNEPESTFQCALDGAAFAACTSPVSLTSLAQGSHTFLVKATDASGNADPTPSSHTWIVDSVAPDTTLSGAPAGTVATASATLTLGTNEAGATFECSLDGAAFAACASPVALSGLADGPHAFAVRARDAAGNLDGSPASAGWTVDTTAPQSTIVSAPSGAVATTGATISFSSEAGATFECALDVAAFAPCTSPVSLSGLAQGAHQFQVRARDAVGNVDATPAVAHWTVDTVVPDTAITSAPANNTNVLPATFTFTATEAGATFECRLDGAAFAACTSPHSYASVSKGSHTFDVRARDAAGNVDGTPATHTWRQR